MVRRPQHTEAPTQGARLDLGASRVEHREGEGGVINPTALRGKCGHWERP